MIYATTKQFLQVFDLKNLKDLPSPKEIEALGIEAMDADVSEEDSIDALEPEEETEEASALKEDTMDAAEPEDEGPDSTPGNGKCDPAQKELDEEPPDSL